MTTLSLSETERAAPVDEVEVEVQVRLTPYGPWHRVVSGRLYTACGQSLDVIGTRSIPPHAQYRATVYDGALCPTCYTGWEIEMAAQNNERRAAELDAKLERERRQAGIERIRAIPDGDDDKGDD